MAPAFFLLLLISVSTFAFFRGSSDERVVATICVLGSFATLFVASPLKHRFQSVETGTLIVDIAVLIGFIVVALRSARFWPLWVAGLQLTTTVGHLFKWMDADLFPRAYAAALQFWSYPILLLLFVGTWRAGRLGETDYENQNPSLG